MEEWLECPTCFPKVGSSKPSSSDETYDNRDSMSTGKKHSELMDADAKILNLNFNGFKLKFSILIKQCDH